MLPAVLTVLPVPLTTTALAVPAMLNVAEPLAANTTLLLPLTNCVAPAGA